MVRWDPKSDDLNIDLNDFIFFLTLLPEYGHLTCKCAENSSNVVNTKNVQDYIFQIKWTLLRDFSLITLKKW